MVLAVAVAEDVSAAGRITGVGGVFFHSPDPKALAAWYRDTLGIAIEDWGGAALKTDAPGHPPVVVWGPFADVTKYFAPSTREFMINFAVDDLDAFLARIAAKGVTPVGRDDSDPSGRFAWIVDPDGTKVELWRRYPENTKRVPLTRDGHRFANNLGDRRLTPCSPPPICASLALPTGECQS